MAQAFLRAPGSNPVVGSSRNRRSGSPARAMATSSRRFCPPDSFVIRESCFGFSPTSSMISSAGRGSG